MKHKTTVDVVSQFVARINAGDLEGLCALMTDDFTFIDYRGKVECGKDVMRVGFKGYFSDYPQYKIITQKVLTGGTGVAIIGQTRGSHVPREVEEKETVLWTADVRDGHVATWRIYADTDTVNQAVQEKPHGCTKT